MEKIELEANERKEIGKKSRFLREKGIIPAVVYGKKMESIPVGVDSKKLLKIFKGGAGRNAIISLKILKDSGVTTLPVITHDMQIDCLSDEITHIDFFRVIMDEMIKTKVGIELSGTSIGVKDDGGIMVHSMHEIEVKCLPGDIPGKILLDVSNLKIGDSIHASEIPVSKNVEIISSPEDIVVTIVPPAKEEIAAPAAVAEVAATTEEAVTAAETESKPESKEKAKEEKK